MRGHWPTTTAVDLGNSFKFSSRRTEHITGISVTLTVRVFLAKTVRVFLAETVNVDRKLDLL